LTGLTSLLTQEKEQEIDAFMKEVNENLDMVIHVGENDSSGSESNPEQDNLVEPES
jgi:hypothetical protein